ncbi:alkyl hydroperoxide reductase/ Thiol specific antioxidant/ Mal allergen [Methylotenera mobilis JLW8]|uniref:thioredoxin-dependent peroxiredoxin n=2 Tax=Methylotenera mobilis TaxID=359408 RepID=C6WYZ5_METML|nr:alkyl hydroperoxide reductase/ Thiol specific antioxidant/ Mal allergen [Methylotenera mobilis JLW8]
MELSTISAINFLMLNQTVPDFQLPATSGKTFQRSYYSGKYLVLYFYPKDSTPGCTTQGMQFRDAYAEFQAKNTEIFGISRDSLKSHENFKAKFSFPFELLADTEEAACTLFNVIKMKNMYGKQVRGIERSTFIIDANGTLIKEWRGVKVDGHAAEVLSFINSL